MRRALFLAATAFIAVAGAALAVDKGDFGLAQVRQSAQAQAPVRWLGLFRLCSKTGMVFSVYVHFANKRALVSCQHRMDSSVDSCIQAGIWRL